MKDDCYEKGKLYQYDGEAFVELEPSADIKLPISAGAMEAVKEVRKAAQRLIGLRPELSLCGSAMLLAAAELGDMSERVRAYGRIVYGSPAAAPAAREETPVVDVEPQGETDAQEPEATEPQGEEQPAEEQRSVPAVSAYID